MNGGFLFVDSPRDFCDDQAFIVRIPPGISSKQKLFAMLADKLRFPRYFGWNWDALEECLGDLSWLPADRPIFLVHEGLPFKPRGKNRKIYLDILQNLAAQAVHSGRVLSFVFPSEVQHRL